MSQEPNSIDCAKAADRLYEYIDGELTPERNAEVQAHLAACAKCLALSEFESAFVRFLEARTRAQAVPEAFRRQVMQNVLFGPGES